MNTATNPKTGEPLKKTKKVLIYGLSETETAQVQDNLPNADIEVMDCTGCFTDIIAHAYIAVIMNPDMLELDDIEYFNEFANDVGAYSEKIIFSNPHDILDRLNRNVRYVVFADAFDFQDKIKYVLLEASREDKRSNSYSDTVSQTIRVLSEIRKHPYTEKKDVWNKARISRIIENAKYTGDGEYDPIIEEETFETAVITKNARKRVEIETECLGISLLRNRVKCGECGYPMVRHTNSKYRIRESWTCQNPECGCRVRILDSHLLEKINVGINRIIENNELMIPHKRTTKATSPAVEELQGKINLELTKETPSEEYIVSLVSDMASQMYRETDAKLMIAARVARQRASMMVLYHKIAKSSTANFFPTFPTRLII